MKNVKLSENAYFSDIRNNSTVKRIDETRNSTKIQIRLKRKIKTEAVMCGGFRKYYV